MTYKEKYSELHLKYEKAGKELETSLKCISEINGFGDVGDIDTYINSQKKFTFYRFQFENLLAYISEGKVDPDSEYIEKEYMYEFIKQDQRQKGVNWDDGDLYPGQSNKNGFYCEIGLTHDSDIEKDHQYSIYKFPVLNLKQGKECFAYLSERLQYGAENNLDFDKLTFSKIDENKVIFVKVKMQVNQKDI